MANDKWKCKYVRVNELVESELNARTLSETDYNALVSNIRKTGGLSSAISCVRRNDGSYLIFSGNHRYKAAVDAGLSEVPVIYADEDAMTKDERLALQLSHNSIAGVDDGKILLSILEQIEAVDWKEAAHIDVDEINEGLASAMQESIVPLNDDCVISVVVSKKGKDILERIIGLVDEVGPASDFVLLADADTSAPLFLSVLKEIRKKFEIKSPNLTFQRLLELAERGLNSEEEEKA